MEVREAIQRRRSVREFVPDRPLGEGELGELLEAATWAPSAGNAQPWRFIVVRDRALREALALAAGGQEFVSQAPVVIVVCADLARARQAYGERGVSLYCLQDTAAAIQNIHLTAVSLGLGTCWVGAFDEGAVAELLRLVRDLRPVALIPVGYPARAARPRPRRSLPEVAEFR